MISNAHMYTTESQPATRFRDLCFADNSGHQQWIRNPRNRLLWTTCCRKRRPAKNLRVKVYTDTIHVFCAGGTGCGRDNG